MIAQESDSEVRSGTVAAALWHRPISSWILHLSILALIIDTVVSFLSLFPSTDLFFTRNYDKILTPLIIVLCGIHLLSLPRIRIDAFGALMVLLLPYGLVVGLVHSGDAMSMLIHTFWGVFIPIIYLSAYNTIWPPGRIETYSAKIAIFFVVCTAVIVALYAAFLIAGYRLYPGNNPTGVFWSALHYMVRGQPSLFLIAVALIVLSGKRTMVVMILIAAVLHFPFLPVARRRLHARIGIAAVVCLTAVAGMVFIGRFMGGYGTFLGNVIGKWALLNPLSANFNLVTATANRALEFFSVVDRLGTGYVNWIFGLGYGWYAMISSLAPDGTPIIERQHYLHFTPLNFVCYYGLPLAVAFYVALWIKIGRIYRWSLAAGGPRSALHTISLFIIGNFVWSFFAFVLTTFPLLWVLLGRLSRLVEEFPQVQGSLMRERARPSAGIEEGSPAG